MSQCIGLGLVHGALFCVGFMGSLILNIKILIFMPFVSFIGCLVFLRKIQKKKNHITWRICVGFIYSRKAYGKQNEATH